MPAVCTPEPSQLMALRGVGVMMQRDAVGHEIERVFGKGQLLSIGWAQLYVLMPRSTTSWRATSSISGVRSVAIMLFTRGANVIAVCPCASRNIEHHPVGSWLRELEQSRQTGALSMDLARCIIDARDAKLFVYNFGCCRPFSSTDYASAWVKWRGSASKVVLKCLFHELTRVRMRHGCKLFRGSLQRSIAPRRRRLRVPGR